MAVDPETTPQAEGTPAPSAAIAQADKGRSVSWASLTSSSSRYKAEDEDGNVEPGPLGRASTVLCAGAAAILMYADVVWAQLTPRTLALAGPPFTRDWLYVARMTWHDGTYAAVGMLGYCTSEGCEPYISAPGWSQRLILAPIGATYVFLAGYLAYTAYSAANGAPLRDNLLFKRPGILWVWMAQTATYIPGTCLEDIAAAIDHEVGAGDKRDAPAIGLISAACVLPIFVKMYDTATESAAITVLRLVGIGAILLTGGISSGETTLVSPLVVVGGAWLLLVFVHRRREQPAVRV